MKEDLLSLTWIQMNEKLDARYWEELHPAKQEQ